MDTHMKLFGIRMDVPSEYIARIVRRRVQTDGTVLELGFIPSVYDAELQADLKAHLEPGEEREILAITPLAIVWGDEAIVVTCREEESPQVVGAPASAAEALDGYDLHLQGVDDSGSSGS